ncbi:ASKHA domain-containing protein, partial [Verrucomicrobiota bacterium]
EKGIIDRAGKFIEGSDPMIETVKSQKRFMLKGTSVHINEDDIANIITAKAAIFAAAKILLDRMNLSFGDIDRLFIAGGFGSFIDIKHAIKIGLLPALPSTSIQYAGNTSLWGAKLAVLSKEAFDELDKIKSMTTYYDLMGSHDYVEQFEQARFLPHTDISLFAEANKHG